MEDDESEYHHEEKAYHKESYKTYNQLNFILPFEINN